MKFLDSKTFSPTKRVKILMFVFLNILALLFFAINVYLGILTVIFINWLTYASLKGISRMSVWIKKTVRNDPFFQNKNFSLVSYSQFSIIAVSPEIVRLVNIKSNIRVHRSDYNISEVYPNYPRELVSIQLNGNPVHYYDIPIKNIKSVDAIEVGDAGGFGVMNHLKFGIRITMISNKIYDIDTPFANDFIKEISSNVEKNIG